MSKEFKINMGLDLDTSDARAALEKFKNNAENTRVEVKVDSDGIKDAEKTSKQLEKTWKELYATSQKLQKQMSKGMLDEGSMQRTTNELNKIHKRMNDIYKQMDASSRKNIDMFNTSQTEKGLANINEALNKIQKTATSLQTKTKGINFEHIDTDKLKEVESKLESIQDIAKKGIDLDMGFEEIGSIMSELKDIESYIKNLEKVENLASSFDEIRSAAASCGVEIQDFSSEIKQLEGLADNLDGSFDSAFKGLKSSISSVKSELKSLNSETKSAFSSLTGSWSDFTGNFAQFTLAEMAGDLLADGIRRLGEGLVDTVVETDKAMTNLMKVAPETFTGTGNQLEQYLNKVTATTKKTGSTITDTIDGTAKALQVGFKTIDEALSYAQNSTIFATIGDMTQEGADSILASVLSAYGGVANALKPVREQVKGAGEDYNTMTKFMDMANYAGNNFALTTEDVGIALQKSGSSLAEQGVKMEESIGMIVAMQENLQDSSKVGNALKTISANMSGVVASAKTGEVQANKTAKVLKEMAGIDVWNKQTGEVKDMYAVMEELHGVWGDLNEDQRSAIAQTIAGKTQLNSFFALMGNWEKASQYVKEYKQGLMVGSAEKEQERYLDSIQGKWASLKASLQGIANNLISSDMVKGVLDVFIKIAEVIEKITSSDLGSFAVGLAGIAAVVGTLYSGFQKLKALGNVVDLLGGKSIADMATTTAKATGTFSTFGTKATTALKSVGTSISAGVKSLGLFSSAGATATTLVSAAFLALPYAIAGYVKYQEYANEKQIKESKETIKALEEQIATNEQASASAKKIAKEYDRLRNTTNKTADEQQRYAELTKQVAEIFPDLVSGYDAQGNPILELNGSLETYIRNLDRAIDKQKELTKSEQSRLAAEQKEYLERIEGYREELEKAQQQSSGKLNSSQYKDLFTGEIDAKKLKNVLEEREKAERESYEKSLEYYEQSQQAKIDIMKDYENKFKDSFGYTRAGEEEQKRLDTMFGNLDLGNLEYKGGDVQAFLKDLTNLNDKLVQSTDEMGEYKDKINEAEEAFGNTMNLKNYTDTMKEVYEATGKIDNESFSQWVDGVREYAQLTGDLEGANKQAMSMCETLETLTGIDAKTWFDGLDFDFAPVEEGTKKLNEFMKAYGTGIQNIGKGGMADKLNREFEQLRDLPMEIADELLENNEITPNFLINATAEMVTPVKELVDEIVSDGEVDLEKELPVLLDVITEIENEGEISEETMAKIKELFPEMTDEEIRQKFTIEADIKNEQAIDKLLKDKDTLSQNVESAIRVNVENAEQAELLYDTLEKVPEEKRVEVANNFGEVQQICRELGINIDDLPDEAIVKMITEGDTEALGKCENLQEVVDYLNNTFNLNLEVTENGEVIEKVKEDVENLPPEKQVEIEIKESGANIQEIKSEIETVPPEKKSTIVIEQSGAAPQEIKSEIETIPPEKEVKINADNSDANSKIEETKSTLDTVQNPNPIKMTADNSDVIEKSNTSNSTVNSVKQNSPIQINANNTNTINSANQANTTVNSVKQNSPIAINADNSGAKKSASDASTTINAVKQNSPVKINADNSDAVSKSTQVIGLLGQIVSKRISVTASVASALSAIGSVISKLRSLGNKSISVTANVTYRQQGVVKTPNGTMSTDAFGTFGHEETFDVMADAPVSGFVTHASASTDTTPITTNKGYMVDAPLYSIDLYTELKNRIEAVNNSLEKLEKQAERAEGQQRISNLEKQVKLYKEEQTLQKELEKNLKKQQGALRSSLQGYGFQFTSDGNLKNYEEKLISMQKELEKLEKATENAQKAEQAYTGKSESKKKSLAAATDKAQQAEEKYADKLSKVKELLDEYLDITYNGIPDAQNAWEDLTNSIKEAEEEMKQIENDMREFANEKFKLSLELNVQSTDRELTDLENKIDLLDAKMEHAEGETLLSLENQKIALLNEQMDVYLEKQKKLESAVQSYKSKLSSYGITFNGDEMANYEDIMIKLHSEESDMYDEVSELAEEYFELLDEEIPNAALAWEELNNEIIETQENIKEMAEEKLEITAEIEEKITDIYKKELEEQIDAMEKATDERIKLLKKEQDAYNAARDEADYQDDLLEQQERINDLNKQIELARRDTSINGQQHLRELMEELKEEQKNFQELTQDHLDEQINDMYDSEIDRIQEESDKAIEDLEEKWSDEKIAQIVANTLASGIFVGINGEVSDLRDKLLETTVESGEAFSVLGAKIQSELCDNLQTALETMQNLAGVYYDMGLSGLDVTASSYNAVSGVKENPGNVTVNSNPTFNIDSNGANIDYDEIQRMIEESNDILINKIIKY